LNFNWNCEDLAEEEEMQSDLSDEEGGEYGGEDFVDVNPVGVSPNTKKNPKL